MTGPVVDYLIKNPEFLSAMRAVEAIRVPHPVRGNRFVGRVAHGPRTLIIFMF